MNNSVRVSLAIRIRRKIASREIFSFLDLPAELRNRVYDYALSLPDGQKIRLIKDHSEPALLRVSRQVRREGCGIYRAINDYKLDLSHGHNDPRTEKALRWAYHYIPDVLPVPCTLTIKTRNVSLELNLELRFDGRPIFTFDIGDDEHPNWPMTVSEVVAENLKDIRSDDPTKSSRGRSIAYALKHIYFNADVDMAEWSAHGVVEGLSKFLEVKRQPCYEELALDYIEGNGRSRESQDVREIGEVQPMCNCGRRTPHEHPAG